jgi:hypothetical protein
VRPLAEHPSSFAASLLETFSVLYALPGRPSSYEKADRVDRDPGNCSDTEAAGNRAQRPPKGSSNGTERTLMAEGNNAAKAEKRHRASAAVDISERPGSRSKKRWKRGKA